LNFFNSALNTQKQKIFFVGSELDKLKFLGI
jgi:hypothetical protein